MKEELPKFLKVELIELALKVAFEAGKWAGQVELEEHFDNSQFAQSALESLYAKKQAMPLERQSTGKTVTVNLRSDKWREEVRSSSQAYLQKALELVMDLLPKRYSKQNGYKQDKVGVVLTYGLYFDDSREQWVTIEATKYDEQTNVPVIWAIRRGGSVMSKFTGSFDYEPMPSSRAEDFFNEYRFSTPNEAANCWSKHYA